MSQSAPTQVSKWCYTYNNYQELFDYDDYLKRAEFKVKRLVYGREVAPTTGMKHHQGYVEFSRSVRISHVKKIFSSAYWVPAKGTSLQNFSYCTKGE